ncbi:MAG: ABC transporter permease [Candidatus Acidiferrales bacterium]
MRQWWSKIARALGRSHLANELQQEMDAHLQFLIDENLERGMPPEEARAAARRHFGNATSVGERSYETWQFPTFESLLRDVRYAARGIWRSRVFSLIVILTLAVGIGANTAIFSAVYAVLLKPLPFPAGERLVWLGESSAKATGISVTWINFEHWRSENHAFDSMAAFENSDLTLTGRGQAVLTHAGVVTNEFFRLTGSRPIMGRLFNPSDDAPQSAATVVVTRAFWTETLSADPQIIGKTINLNGTAHIVIGVLARDPGFFLPPVDYYLPFHPSVAEASKRDTHEGMRALAVLKPGFTLSQARSDLDTIMQRLAQADPGPESDHRAYAEFLTQHRTGDLTRVFILLMAAVCLVLLLACANIGGLLLIRMTTRAREMAIRTAIGAGRRRLARQLLTETILITLLGGAAGIFLAGFGLRAIEALGPRDIPRLSEASLNLPVLIFAAALTLAVALVCSLVPLVSLNKMNLMILLKEGSTSAGTSWLGHTLRGGLVIAEIAAAVILLFTSGILLRSLWAAESLNPGFEPSHVLALELQLPPLPYKSDTAILDFYARLEAALRAQPGVESVGAINCPPAAGDCRDWWYSVAEKPTPGPQDVPVTLVNMADPAYFAAMRIPLVAGRAFSDQDRAGEPPVAAINEEIARAWWKDPDSALGQHIKLGGPYMDGPVVEIVGVAASVPQIGLDTSPLPEIYLPAAQRVDAAMVVMIRTRSNPESMMATVRQTLASMDDNVPIQSLKTARTWLGATLVQRRFTTLLLVLFTGIAVMLASIGCYGVFNYWVSCRRQEIAIRMAMGAGTIAIIRCTGRQTARLGLIGLAAGLTGSWAASRWLNSLVFGVSTHDPFVLGAAAAAAFLIVLLSAALPLWRATQIDPIEALHEA